MDAIEIENDMEVSARGLRNQNVKIDFAMNKILLHPEQFKAIREGDISAAPISIELSLTNSCNIDCVWCVDVDWRGNHKGTIDPDFLLPALEEFRDMGTKGVVVEGGGEPTVHPRFREIVEGILDLGLSVGLITNGTYFKDFDLVPHFEWIRVSLDASTREEYLEAKKKDLFDKLLDNVGKMADAAKGHDTIIGIGYLISTLSITDVPGIAKKCKDLGVDYFQMRRLTEHEEYALPKNYHLSEVEALSDSSFTVHAHQMEDATDTERGNLGLPCVAHQLSSVICQDGSIFFCCRLHALELPSGKHMGVIGNIYDQSVAEIWGGKRRRLMAEKMLLPSECQKHCPECRMTKYNLLVHELRQTKSKNFI